MSVDKLVDSTQLDADLTSVANAIRTKGGTSASLAFPADFVSAIAAIPSGGGGDDRADLTVPKDVDFIDFDGRLVYSYTTNEFLALDSMPSNPSYTGLTAQGWNWTLEDAKAFVQAQGALVIGQSYTTNDGKTRIYITLDDSYIQRCSGLMELYIRLNANSSAKVDWGDGTSDTQSTTNQAAKTYTHNYSASGDYLITIDVTGSIGLGYFGSNRSIFNNDYLQNATVKKIEIGNNVTQFGRQPFFRMVNLVSVSIPTTCNSWDSSYDLSVFSSNRIGGIVFPSGLAGRYKSLFEANEMALLKYVSFPKSFTDVQLGRFPWNLRKFILYNIDTANTGSSGGVTYKRLNLNLYRGPSLTHFIIPGTYEYIATDTLHDSKVQKLTIPASVLRIDNNALSLGPAAKEIHMLPTTPPILGGTGALTGKTILSGNGGGIYVPYSADHSVLNAYKTASNWSTWANVIYEEAAP